MAAALTSSQLAELAAEPVIGSWAEAVEQETLGGRAEGTKDGIKTVTDIVTDETGKYKVITTFKVVTKKVPRPVAERKKWKKFGSCAHDGPGPQVGTTSVAEEVQMQFVRNRFGEQQLDAGEETSKIGTAKSASVTHCRYCKSDCHWSVECPYKAMYVRHEDESAGDTAEKDSRTAGTFNATGTPKTGVYVPPGARDGRVLTGGAIRSEENTCRVTNLPEECDEQELRHLFGQVGTVTRVFIAKDKHTNRPKGFAFVTYERREQAEMAIQKLNGYKMDHLVLKVEWTRPNN